MKRWMILGAMLLTAVLAFAFVACSSGNKDNKKTPTAEATTPATEVPTAETPPAAAGSVTVTLASMDASGATGTAVLTASDGGTTVEVTVDEYLTEGAHQNHIHVDGQCETPGPVETPLTELTADAAGAAGPTSTTVPTALSDLEDGNHYVAVHAANGDVVACGNIAAM